VLNLSSTVEAVVITAAGLTALGVIIQKGVRPLWRFVRWVRTEVRDEIARRKKIDEILERELTHNGGSSMKDHAAYTREQIDRLTDQIRQTEAAQKATVIVLDRIVERRAIDESAHAEIWAALAEMGVDRRDPPAKPRRKP
jgi:hypothetical protein